MDQNNKKLLKKTNMVQFQKLVELMEEHPQLATGSPTFGSSRVAVEEMWDNVAKKVNAFGPPTRTGSEWKKVWQDQKCRLKKKISENNKSLHGTGGGPCSIINLSQIEQHIDRICHLSSAAAPVGTVLGLSPALRTIELTPPRRREKIAVVTPTTSKQADIYTKEQNKYPSDLFASNISDIIVESPQPSPKIIIFPQETMQPSQQEIKHSIHRNRKRKNNENTTERMKLLHQQIDIQSKTLDIMNRHLETVKMQAEAAKNQADAAIDQANALKEIANSTKIMGQALVDIFKHIKDDD